ncbi:hypothetical protein [Pseudomonas sp. URIL14HWK12:I6]
MNSRTPIEMFSTEDGATAVTDLVERPENGILCDRQPATK